MVEVSAHRSQYDLLRRESFVQVDGPRGLVDAAGRRSDHRRWDSQSSSQIFGKTPDKNTLSRHDGVEEYPTITTLAESPLTANVLWVGTDDGNLQVSRDGGKTWKNVASRAPGVHHCGTYVTRWWRRSMGEGSAFVTFDGHRTDDYNVYLFQTSDYGETWKAIRNGIPDSAGTVHVVREHSRSANLLFAGTEFGLWGVMGPRRELDGAEE